jgi:hypothetical protein
VTRTVDVVTILAETASREDFRGDRVVGEARWVRSEKTADRGAPPSDVYGKRVMRRRS